MTKILILLCLFSLNVFSEYKAPERLTASELRDLALKYVKPISKKKYYNKNKLELGRMLYFEKKLSTSKSISCGKCHDFRKNGIDNKTVALKNVESSILPYKRNTISIFNSSLNRIFNWDGEFKNLESLISDKILTPHIYGNKNSKKIMKNLDRRKYIGLFNVSYTKSKDIYSYKNMIDALSYFVKSLIRTARIDDFLQGDLSALTKSEQRGFKMFIDKGCINCHDGRNFGGTKLKKFGVKGPYKSQDPGRFLITKKEEDRFVFRVPSLRNVINTAPYFHDGKSKSITSAIRNMANLQLGIKLNNNEVDDIKIFLDSLSLRKRY